MLLDNRYATLDPRLFHRQPPSPLQHPRPVHFNHTLAARLDWPWRTEAEWLPIVSGQVVPEGFDPLAMAYAGHQFGHFSPQLGDGRALLLGELVAPDGARFDASVSVTTSGVATKADAARAGGSARAVAGGLGVLELCERDHAR